MLSFERAREIARERKCCILLTFTGSDWCHWSKRAMANVVNTDEFRAHCESSDVLITIVDFVTDLSKHTKQYLQNQNNLQNKFNVKTFPTFLVLDSKLTTIGRLRYADSETPKSFGKQLDKVLRMREGNRMVKAAAMSDEDAKVFLQAYKNYKRTKNSLYQLCLQQKYHNQKTTKKFQTLTKETRNTREIYFAYYDD